MSNKVPIPELWFLRGVLDDDLEEQSARLLAPGGAAFMGKLREHIHKALSKLSYRERGVLEMRHGLGDGWSYTLAEVGQVFKLTRERIRQIQVKATRKLLQRGGDLVAYVERLGEPEPPPPPRRSRKTR